MRAAFGVHIEHVAVQPHHIDLKVPSEGRLRPVLGHHEERVKQMVVREPLQTPLRAVVFGLERFVMIDPHRDRAGISDVEHLGVHLAHQHVSDKKRGEGLRRIPMGQLRCRQVGGGDDTGEVGKGRIGAGLDGGDLAGCKEPDRGQVRPAPGDQVGQALPSRDVLFGAIIMPVARFVFLQKPKKTRLVLHQRRGEFGFVHLSGPQLLQLCADGLHGPNKEQRARGLRTQDAVAERRDIPGLMHAHIVGPLPIERGGLFRRRGCVPMRHPGTVRRARTQGTAFIFKALERR